MMRFVADEDFDNGVIRGLRHRISTIDIVRVQDVGLTSAPDQDVLVWSAAEGRVLLTHDVSTMTRSAYERLSANQPMPGLFVIACSVPIGRAIEDILFVYESTTESEWDGKVLYLPL